MDHVEQAGEPVNGTVYEFDHAVLNNAISKLPNDAQYAIRNYWPSALAASRNKVGCLHTAAVAINRFAECHNLPRSIVAGIIFRLAAKHKLGEDAAQRAIDQLGDDFDLAEMNKKYAVVNVTGKTRIVWLEESPVFSGCKVPVFSTIPDFCAFHSNRKKTFTDRNGRLKEIGLGRWWVNHNGRRQ
jgi:hypothetical protein